MVNNPCWLDCYIDTCSKKTNQKFLFKSRRCSAPHSKLVTSVVRAGEGCCREGEMRRSSLNFQAVILSLPRKFTMNEAVWDVETTKRTR